MKKIVFYPAFEITQTYIGANAEEIDNIQYETEQDLRLRYGIGWNNGIETLYDETCPLCGVGKECSCRNKNKN